MKVHNLFGLISFVGIAIGLFGLLVHKLSSVERVRSVCRWLLAFGAAGSLLAFGLDDSIKQKTICSAFAVVFLWNALFSKHYVHVKNGDVHRE